MRVIQEPLKAVRRNLKLECIIFLLFIILSFAELINPSIVKMFLELLRDYLNEERVSALQNFFSITIGIYIAIITIVGTSVIGVSESLLRENKDCDLLTVFLFGVTENLLVVAISVFYPKSFPLHYILLFAFICMSLISLVKFVVLISLLFIANMKKISKQLDKEEALENKILNHLEDIVRNTRK